MSDMTIEVVAAYAVSILIASIATYLANRKLNELTAIQLELGVEKHLVPNKITWYNNRGAIKWAKKHRNTLSGEKARLVDSVLFYEKVGWFTLLLPFIWLSVRFLFDG
jgi:hypothetical protein